MALTWDFKKDYIGYAKASDDFPENVKIRIYSGNALAIICTENDDAKTYALQFFIADKIHAKNMLEKDYIKKDLQNLFQHIYLDSSYSHVFDLANFFTKCNIDVTIYNIRKETK